MERSKKMVSLFCIVVTLMAVSSMATMEEDAKDCADQLTNLASCIPFVSGDAKKPTPQCCEDTQKVKSTKPKCLCVLIKESADPSMGLPVNTTLALQMPSACNIDAKVSDCPTLLKLPADSPDAKIFKQAGTDSTSTSTPITTTDSTPTSNNSSPSSSSPSGTSSPTSNSKETQSSSDGAKILERASLLVMMMMASISWMFMI